MLEYKILSNPSSEEITEFAKGILSGENGYFESAQRLLQQNMTVRGNEQLLICQDTELQLPVGYAAFESISPDSLDDIGEASRIFSYGKVSIFRDAELEKSQLKECPIYCDYQHKGNLLFIKNIEVALDKGRKGIGTGLYSCLVETQKPELVEAMALPHSITFWTKTGLQPTGLCSRELISFAKLYQE